MDHVREPRAVVADARAADDVAGPAMNLVLADPTVTGEATVADGRYEGPQAAACGHLEAALSVADGRDDVRLHHGDVDLTAAGPWIVLAPLSGVVATVSTGTAAVTVDLACPDGRAATVRDRLDALLDAAAATHEHYPVADDDRGVFTTGMTTFELRSVERDDGTLAVTVDASTTPATTRSGIVDRFADVADVEAVDVTFGAGVERAAPSADLRAAVDAAHEEAVGDAQYDWLAEPTVFARIPGGDKVAVGAGEPDGPFTSEQYEQTRAVLRAVRDRLAVSG